MSIMNTIAKHDLVDAFLDCFQFLQLDATEYQKFLDLYGQPFDIRSFKLDDYIVRGDATATGKYERSFPYMHDNSLKLDIGNGFMFYFEIEDTRAWGPTYMSIVLMHEGKWCVEFQPSIDANTLKYHPESDDAVESRNCWMSAFSAIIKRAQIVLRGYAAYMANKQKYDDMQRILDIKLRKKK
jgi:hypothetical protein